MPTYEYECRTCGYTFERVQNMSDEPVRECPECGKEVRRNIFGGSGVIFKGSGFYVNDSRGKNPAAPAASKSNSGDQSGSPAPSPDNKKAESTSAGSSAPSATAAGAPSGAAAQSGAKTARE